LLSTDLFGCIVAAAGNRHFGRESLLDMTNTRPRWKALGPGSIVRKSSAATAPKRWTKTDSSRRNRLKRMDSNFLPNAEVRHGAKDADLD
jgi:hypothetical protein